MWASSVAPWSRSVAIEMADSDALLSPPDPLDDDDEDPPRREERRRLFWCDEDIVVDISCVGYRVAVLTRILSKLWW